jgi:hypothetical protein
MGPTETMGLFLRTWRKEWAGLSRAHLALAVSAQCECQNGKRIASAVVRKWERGQPPETTEELAALTLVMRRHGLQASEVEHFRQAVFAACVARQYPSLLEQDDLVYREDLAEVAQALFARHWETPGSANLVQLTAAAVQLERAVRGALYPAAGRQRTRRQQLALCHLWALLADAHAYAGRLEQAADTLAGNAHALEAWFGPRGLGGPLTPLAQRTGEAYLRSLMPWPRRKFRPGPASAAWALRLLALSEEATSQGEDRTGRRALFYALDALSDHEHERPAYEMCRARSLDAVVRAEDAGDRDLAETGRLLLFNTSRRDGALEQAEGHLAGFAHMATAGPVKQVVWHECLAVFASARGDTNEARSEAERALAVARQAGGLADFEAGLRHMLQQLEGKRKPRRRLGAR